MRSTSIGKDELTEEAFEIIAVVVSHVPEDRLKVTRSCRLIDRIDNLFKAILNNTHNPENFKEKNSRNETKEETSNKETNAGRQNERIKQRV